MPKGGKSAKPPTAEEIAEMMGVAPEKTFKVDHEGMGKVRAAEISPFVPVLAGLATVVQGAALSTRRVPCVRCRPARGST